MSLAAVDRVTRGRVARGLLAAGVLSYCSVVGAQSGPVAVYSFDSTGGNTVLDGSGNNLTGTLSGAVWTSQGRFGGALSFDGVNDWVTIADANVLDLTTGMTLEAWVYPTAAGGATWRNVLIKERSNGESYNLYAADDANRPVVYVVRAAQTGVPLDAAGSAGGVPLNAWTHLAATYDGATLRLFVNGQQAGSRAVSGALVTSTGVLRIGGNNIWGEFFQGRIDEVRIYNRALGVAELQTDMVTPIVPTVDTTPPALSNGAPAGTLPAGTTQAVLAVATSEAATCRYSTTAGVAYGGMTGSFATTGGTSHSTPLTGLVNGGSYSYYVRCQDAAQNATTADFPVSFAVANPVLDLTPPVLSNGAPGGTLAVGTTQATLAVTTSEAATCRYGAVAGVDYTAMPSTFAATGGTGHTTTVAGLVNGTAYAFFVRCRDGAGNANPVDYGINFAVASPPVDAGPPQVNITAPAAGSTVGGNVTLAATATDDIGVVGVQFFVDGVPVGAEDTAAPFSVAWNTAGVANGLHQITARARDAVNNQTTSAAVAVTVNSAASGLAAAWSFDSTAGNTVLDVSGNNLTGTLAGASWTSQGRFGGALSFDGVNDWVTVADANVLDLTTGMTLEAWVFPTAPGVSMWRNVLIKERSGGESYNLYAADGVNRPAVYVVRAAQTGVPLDAVGAAGGVPLNAWTHLAATYDGSTLRLFVNGQQAGTRAVSGAMVTSTGALRIGGNSLWGEFFEGRIDEVRIYNRALGAAEIQADMLVAIGGVGLPDTTPPTLSNALPSGTLSYGTTQTALSVATNEAATCRYSTTAGLVYGVMTSTFATTGGTTHSTPVNGLVNGGSYSYYVRCIDTAGNPTPSDTVVTFAVAATPATPPSLPAGAIGYYNFGTVSNGAIGDQVQGPDALPPLLTSGTDYQVSNGTTIWNANIGDFTQSFPFDADNGTFAEMTTTFPNDFPAGGSLAVRLRIDPAVVAELGQGSGVGLVTFRGSPDINIHRVTPRGIEIRRDGPSDPLYFLAREGENSIGYNSEFNDQVASAPLTNPTAETTVVVVWTPSVLRIYVDGVLSGTTARVTANHSTPNYRILVAAQPGLIHGGDNQFFRGAIRSFVVYDRPLSGAEVTTLHGALAAP